MYNSSNESISDAGEFISQHITSATGATMAKEGAPSWSSDAKYIVIGDKNLAAQAGVTLNPLLQEGGYQITRKGDSIFILANDDSAYQIAALKFLEEFLGFVYFDTDLTVYEKRTWTDAWYLPQNDIYGKASVAIRTSPLGWASAVASYYGLGYTDPVESMLIPTRVLTPSNGGYIVGDSSAPAEKNGDTQIHTSFYYISPTEYGTAHPNWFSTNEIDASSGSDVSVSSTQTQLCYTAHGNADDLAAMQKLVADKLTALALSDRDAIRDVVMFGAQDINIRCGCSSCQAIEQKYGSLAAANIIFTNGVAKLVEENLAAKGRSDRQLKILFFAYQHASTPPNAQALADGIICDSEGNVQVGVRIASSKTNYSWKFTDAANAVHAAEIEGWGQFTENIYYYLYNHNWGDFFAPSNIFESTKANLEFVIENSAKGVYIQSAFGENDSYSGFSHFKLFLEGQLMVDITREYEDIKDTYFKYYFGQGGSYMETFFDEVVAYMNTMRNSGNEDFYGKIVNQNCGKADYWSLEKIQRYYDLCEQALAALDTSDENYEVYKKHIMIEQLFPRYMLARYGASNYQSYFSGTQLTEFRKAFAQDIHDLGITKYSGTANFYMPAEYENGVIKNNCVYDWWGIREYYETVINPPT